jgi:hypothetical protein
MTTAENDMAEYIDVGTAYIAPGHDLPLGPTRIAVRSGHIVSVRPLFADDLQPDVSHLLVLPALEGVGGWMGVGVGLNFFSISSSPPTHTHPHHTHTNSHTHPPPTHTHTLEMCLRAARPLLMISGEICFHISYNVVF